MGSAAARRTGSLAIREVQAASPPSGLVGHRRDRASGRGARPDQEARGRRLSVAYVALCAGPRLALMSRLNLHKSGESQCQDEHYDAADEEACPEAICGRLGGGLVTTVPCRVGGAYHGCGPCQLGGPCGESGCCAGLFSSGVCPGCGEPYIVPSGRRGHDRTHSRLTREAARSASASARARRGPRTAQRSKLRKPR